MFHLLNQYFWPAQSLTVEETVTEEAPAILLLHGANATPSSFNYIRTMLPDADYHIVEYSVANSFYSNLDRMIEEIDPSLEYHMLSHSMGGLFGLHLSQHLPIKSSISVATPFGGTAVADWGRYMIPSYQLFRDVHTKSRPILDAKPIQLQIPWKQIVTTRGSVPWMKMPNDGIVTVKSMIARTDMEHIELDESHNEVLLSDDLVDIIRKDFFNS